MPLEVLRDGMRGGRFFLKACCIGTLTAGMLLVPVGDAAAAPHAGKKQAAPPKKKKTPAPAAKTPTSRKPYTAPPPLTAESLGLTTPLSEAAATTPPTPTPTQPATEPAAASSPPPAPAPEAAAPPAAPSSTPSIDPLASPADRDRVLEPTPGPRRRLTIGLNPLPVVAGRYGLNIELVPFRHSSIIVSGWVQTFTPSMLRVVMPKAVDVSNGADTKFGGELGWRVYTGSTGANGLFAGLSGVAMPLAYPRVTQDLRSEVVSFHAFGGAFDIGAQAITSSGFTIGGGIGVMYLAYAPPSSATPPPGVGAPKLVEPHILPRLLLSAGWSF